MVYIGIPIVSLIILTAVQDLIDTVASVDKASRNSIRMLNATSDSHVWI
jgi:hypothetical protein